MTTLIDVVAGRIRQATPAVKCELLPVLGCLGGKPALAAVRSELRRSDSPTVRAAAIATLADWRDDGAAADLLAAARDAELKDQQGVAVRGYLRMIELNKGRPAEETARMCGEALGVVPNRGQKTALLSRLGNLEHVVALRVVEPCLADRTVQQEACDAATRIASNLDPKHKAEIVRVLGLVLKASKKPATIRAAREVLNRPDIRAE
jgi:hypothetical protein